MTDIEKIPLRRSFTYVTTLHGDIMLFEQVAIDKLELLWPDGRKCKFEYVYINDTRFANSIPPNQNAMNYVLKGLDVLYNDISGSSRRMLMFPNGHLPNVNCVGGTYQTTNCAFYVRKEEGCFHHLLVKVQ